MNKQYAHALFQIAKEDNTLNECKESFDVFVAILKENSDFELVLNSPKVKTEEKKDLIKKTFKDCDLDFIYFLCVILDNRRMDKVLGIYEEFLHLYNEENKIKVVKVLSDETLTNLEEEKLLQSLKIQYPGYNVIINNQVDKTIVGGYHIFVNGKSMDLSFKRKVKNLEEFLLTKTVKEVI